MPPFPGMPYPLAPSYCFPLTELCMYILTILCFKYAVKQGIKHISYLLGGVLFGLILEYVNVVSNMGYTYGKFIIMFGHLPFAIPLCIGLGWGTIMYTARLFSDKLGLSLWPAVALDTLLAISIDLSMDAVAYRLHMWHWNWKDTGLNPLTADWFGVPFGNFYGWLLVVFLYSSISRLLEQFLLHQKKRGGLKFAVVPLLSVFFSQVILYVMLVHVDTFLFEQFGIKPLHRFIVFLIVLFIITIEGWRKRKRIYQKVPSITWIVPLWFHLYFFGWLFIGGFYSENLWLVAATVVNLIIGVSIHLTGIRKKSFNAPLTSSAV